MSEWVLVMWAALAVLNLGFINDNLKRIAAALENKK